MKVGIYNRYLTTFGGGENYMGAIAEALSRAGEHEVDILSYEDVSLADITAHLDVDLGRCRYRRLPYSDNQVISVYTGEYDLFINCSYGSCLMNRARKGVLVVFFPRARRRRETLLSNRWVNWTGRALRQMVEWFIVVYGRGFFYAERCGRWMQRTGEVEFYSLFNLCRRRISVHFVPGVGEKPSREWTFHLNDRRVEPVKVDQDKLVFKERCWLRNRLRLTAVHEYPIDTRRGSAMLNRVACGGFPRASSRIERMLQRVRDRLIRLDGYTYLRSYDLILAISAYTQRWIKTVTGADAGVLYPAIRTEQLVCDGDKKNIVLSVGRFFAGGHNKKHLVMINAFMDMLHEGLTGWELHMFGNAHRGPGHDEYLEQCRRAVRDERIVLHVDAPFEELRRGYGEAAIFWHATGYGEDESREPEKMEHFGISTVEAMAAGCIPIVIAKAGQTEIVTNGMDGFLWSEVDDLKRRTWEVVRMPPGRRNELRRAATKRAQEFSRRAFDERLRTIVASL